MASSETESRRVRAAAAVGLAALAILTLQLAAIDRQSLTGDAAYHLLAGHQALRYGTNTLNLEHPPLVKLVAAFPLLWEEPLAPPASVDRALELSQQVFADPERLERVRRRSRWLLLGIFGLPLIAACFLLGHRIEPPDRALHGGLASALAFGLAFPVIASLSILQTDTAVSLGLLLTLLAGCRFLRLPTLGSAALLGLALGLSLASKFSAVLFLPIALLAVLLARDANIAARGRAVLLIATVAAGTTWTTYALANHDYDPAQGRDTIQRYCRGEALVVDDRLLAWESRLLAVERFDPYLAQWLTGLVGIRAQNAIGIYPSYAFGTVSSQGRWWYFPVLFGVKTPLVVLIALAIGLVTLKIPRFEALRFQRPPPLPTGPKTLLLAAAAIYLGVAVTSNYNLGFRHLLPILPILYLPASRWLATRSRWTWLFGVVLLVESLALAPHWMSATNTWWLGERNPTRFAFGAGNTEYHQNFLSLAEVAESRQLEPLTVVYPLVSAEEIQTYLPTAQVADPDDLKSSLPPGWYAVNVLVEQFLPAAGRASPDLLRGAGTLRALAGRWQPLWNTVRQGEDHGWIAGTFRLYHLPAVAPLTPSQPASPQPARQEGGP